jgi:hypothetical protein
VLQEQAALQALPGPAEAARREGSQGLNG